MTIMVVRVQVPPSVHIKSQDESLGFFVSWSKQSLLGLAQGNKKRPFYDLAFFKMLILGLTEGNSRLQYRENT